MKNSFACQENIIAGITALITCSQFNFGKFFLKKWGDRYFCQNFFFGRICRNYFRKASGTVELC